MALMLLYLSSSNFEGHGLGFDEVINLADHVAFETTTDVTFGFAFCCPANHFIPETSWVLTWHSDHPSDQPATTLKNNGHIQGVTLNRKGFLAASF